MQQPTIVNLPKILDIRGNLSLFEGGEHIPFGIKRTYLIYDVPGGETRGGHAYREQQEFIVSLSGSFDLVVRTRSTELRFFLNRSYYGLYIPAGYWRHMENFSTNSVALVAASTLYDEADYIRDFDSLPDLYK
jgi:dTDP-4-dehydrorhamnose 3,5-epimerase-like enzyme